MSLPINQIIQGDALQVLKTFPNESVDCIITSPPYWGLRFYGEESNTVWGGDPNCKHEWGKTLEGSDNLRFRKGKSTTGGNNKKEEVYTDKSDQGGMFCKKCGAWYGQLGLEPTLEMYLEHMLEITAELKRILKKTGTMFWNHGDNYSNSGGWKELASEKSGLCGGSGRNPKLTAFFNMPKLKTSIPPKSLCLQNFRLVQRMIDEQGWILRNVIIWWKPNVMPQSVKDRFTVDFEPVFFFVKNKKYYFEQQFDPLSYKDKRGKQRIVYKGKLFKYRSNLNIQSADYFGQDPKGRNKRCIWRIPTKGFKEAHFAVFPEELVEPMIKAGCPQEGIVLDPFIGSGTTAVVAKKLGRNYIGIEINPNYVEILKKRLEQVPDKLL